MTTSNDKMTTSDDRDDFSITWVPFRIILHKDVLEDTDVCKLDANWYILDMQVPENCAPTIIVSSTNLPPEEEEIQKALSLAHEFTLLNSGIDDEGNYLAEIKDDISE